MWPMKVAMPYQTSDTVLIDRTMAQSTTPPVLAMGSVPMPGRMTGLGGKEGQRLRLGLGLGLLWCIRQSCLSSEFIFLVIELTYIHTNTKLCCLPYSLVYSDQGRLKMS